MKTNQKKHQREATERLGARAYADQLLKFANRYSKRCRRCIRWSIFLAYVGVLLVVGIAVSSLPLVNGEPIYDIDDQLASIILITGAAINVIAMMMAGTAKEHHRKATDLLIKRGDLLDSVYLKALSKLYSYN